MSARTSGGEEPIVRFSDSCLPELVVLRAQVFQTRRIVMSWRLVFKGAIARGRSRFGHWRARITGKMKSGKQHGVVPARRLVIWGVVALGGVLAFCGAVITQSRRASERWASLVSARPVEGERVFREKDCIRCHAINGIGGTVGPDLGRKQQRASSLPQLVTAMWNHAPRMWDRMQADHITYPSLNYEEVAQLFAYLYMSRHVDELGDVRQGQMLFVTKDCIRCHSVRGKGGKVGPDLSSLPATTPIAWTQIMWNHASNMEATMRRMGVQWPQFQGHELRDLFAYVNGTGVPSPLRGPGGDPERGWKLFQNKSCIACHSIREGESGVAPNLGPGTQLPPTLAGLGGLMLNHSPQMRHAMSHQGIEQPEFSGEELTDLFAFLYSLRYFEPAGSPQVGESVFSWRGCNRCHGRDAEGTDKGPALRGRGRQYSSIFLAATLWHHGREMYEQTRHLGVGWPTLMETDVGDLLAFLNSRVERARGRGRMSDFATETVRSQASNGSPQQPPLTPARASKTSEPH